MTIPKINNILSAEEYHAHSGLSKTQIGYLKQSPLHLRTYLDAPRTESTPDQKFGTACHTAVFEPERFESSYAVAPEGIDRRTTAGKAAWAEFQSQNVGKELLKAEDYDAVRALAYSVGTCKALQKFGIGYGDGAPILRGIAEASVFGVDFGTNLAIKGRFDYYDEETDVIIDLKTCLRADYWSARKDLVKYGYPIQADHYIELAEQNTGRKTRFIFAFVEKSAPYGVQLLELDAASYEKVRAERWELIRRWANALKTNTFSSYPSEVQNVSLVS
jgi:hypothetical protein